MHPYFKSKYWCGNVIFYFFITGKGFFVVLFNMHFWINILFYSAMDQL